MQKLLLVPFALIIGSAIHPTSLMLVYALFGATIFDFVTGIMAAWIEDKNQEKKYKAYFIQSNKIRKSVVKTMSYIFFILGTMVFSKALNVVDINLIGIDTTPTILAFLCCIGIEVYSVVENIKRCGFDIAGEFIKLVKFVVGLKNKVTKEVDNGKS